MSRLSQIGEAIATVVKARAECPFSKTYRGRPVSSQQACPKCGLCSNGDGGRCTVDAAAYSAIEDIEKALA